MKMFLDVLWYRKRRPDFSDRLYLYTFNHYCICQMCGYSWWRRSKTNNTHDFYVLRLASATHHYQYSVLSKPKGAYSYLHHRLYHSDLAITIRAGKIHARNSWLFLSLFITDPAVRQALPNDALYPTCYTKHP